MTYVAGTTTRDTIAVPDNSVPPLTTLFPLDETGLVIPILRRGESTVIHYHTTINVGASGAIQNNVTTSFPGVQDDAQIDIPPPAGDTPCVLRFTDIAWADATAYTVGANVYVELNDPDANMNATAVETYTVVVRDGTIGDYETIVLTETGISTRFFRSAALATSTTAGLGVEDGTLHVVAGDSLSVSHTDPLYATSCTDTATISAPSGLSKPLYLNTDGTDGDTSGALDRVDPVTTSDATTSQTAVLAGGGAITTVAGTTKATSGSGVAATTLTFAHNPGGGSNRLLLVAVSTGSSNNTLTQGTVSGVTFNGNAMTLVGSAIRATGTNTNSYIYMLKDADMGTTGSADVVVAASSSTIVATATTFNGVRQTTPLGTFVSRVSTVTGTALSLSTPYASAVGELVYSVGSIEQGTTARTITTSTANGQLQLANYSSNRYVDAATSTMPGAASVSPAYTASAARNWTIGVVAIKPAVGDSAVFTQSPTLAGAFTLPAGGILSVRSYASVASGSFAAIPAITATVKRNGTTIGSALTSPTATILSGTGAVVTTSSSSTSVANGGTLTFSHTPGSTANRLLLVSVGVGNTLSGDAAAPGTVTGVTFGAVAMTQVSTAAVGAIRTYVYRLLNPNAATANVVVTIGSKTASVSASATTFTGVHQTTPLGASASSTGTGTALSTTLAAVTGDIVYSAAALDEGGTNQTITTNSTLDSQVELANNSGLNYVSTASGTKAGAASVTVNYTALNSQQWAMLAVPIKPVLITPAVYQLDWNSAGLAGAVAVSAGEALSLTVENARIASFSLLYDSSTYPAKITLPTSTVISVNSVAVYDAPYPGGNLAPAAATGQILYVRAVVSDPFGAADITSLPVTIDGPGTAGDLSTTLTDSSVVASTTGTKTYEYAWHTGATTGSYAIAVTAKEGTENTITDQKSTAVTLSLLDLGTPCANEFTATLNGVPTTSYAANGTIYLRVTDLDRNTTGGIDTIAVTLNSSSGDAEAFTLSETGTNTGVFAGSIPSSTTTGSGNNDLTLYAPAGSVLTLGYTDIADSLDVCTAAAIISNTVPAISLVKTLITPADGQIVVGEAAQFRIRVVNTGNTTLPTVQVVDTFPATKLTYVSASTTPNTVAAGSLTWDNVGPLTPGESVDILVTFTGLAAIATPGAANTAAVSTGGSPTAPNSTAYVIVTRPALTRP